ncbi:hypothetical protein BpHYR1_038809 [Brachionus plicatilis]|uniref:Uncharacterized protein n=1 Tax=Brachionus plicatilis TaxID=10195 RepID=A0A3M7QQH1_BRAPC|nr:hypothetical protein BpHYR1_038809 [Brachionus plicatilis]
MNRFNYINHGVTKFRLLNFLSPVCNKWTRKARKTILRMERQAIIEIDQNLKTFLNSSKFSKRSILLKSILQ